MDEMLIDYSEKIVAIAGHRMEFTKIEYQIIEFLSMHPGQVFDKEQMCIRDRFFPFRNFSFEFLFNCVVFIQYWIKMIHPIMNYFFLHLIMK